MRISPLQNESMHQWFWFFFQFLSAYYTQIATVCFYFDNVLFVFIVLYNKLITFCA